jgi:hypothetical protein
VTVRLVIWFAAILLLAVGSRATLERGRADRCSLDGNRIIPVYRVDLMVDGGVLERFCCVRCAAEWPEVPDGAYWQVRDEVTGAVLDAERASFVESTVVTIPSRQDRVHVFRRWADALEHVTAYDGRRIANPLDRGRGAGPETRPPSAAPDQP